MKKYSRRERKIAEIAKREGYMEGYQQGLRDGNPFILVGESVAKLISAMEDTITDPAFIEACNADLPTLEEAERDQIKKYFKGKCPYTDKKCEDWRCQNCEVEAAERKYMENDSEE